jgi:hypothetical protein
VTESDDDPEFAAVDRVVGQWRQGDCVLGEHWFVHRVSSKDAADQHESDIIETAVRGFMVLTQTCDVVRECSRRPFIEVAPLVEVDNGSLHAIERGRRPTYAFVPGLADQHLVADLDRTMTVEKAVVAGWERIVGCRNEIETRALAQSLARKRARFAFPDDFTSLASNLQERLTDKHDKNSPEGRALRSLREIRVQATPTWDAAGVELMFWFIREGNAAVFEGSPWEVHLAAWLGLAPPAGRFSRVEGQVVALEDMTARDYVDSDPLDLDHLSSRTKVPPK